MSDWIRNGLRGAGLEVVPVSRTARAETLLGLHLAKLFSRLAINCVIDVGARRGEYAVWLRQNGFQGAIASFEPVSESFVVLRDRAMEDPGWLTFHLAIGSRDELRDINVTSLTSFSSFLSPTAYSLAEFGQFSTVRRTETVQVKRLDSVFAEAFARVDDRHTYLKMDTQGWDLEVLKGATACLEHVLALQTEVSLQAIYHGIPSLPESVTFLNELGFVPSGMFPVTLDSRMALVDADLVAVRK